MNAGLLFGHDPGLDLGHARIGPALDEALGVERGFLLLIPVKEARMISSEFTCPLPGMVT